MATISTIKPGGGGDYTSLHAWWDAVKTAPSADQWAECYSGDCGTVFLTGHTFTPDSNNYVRIYAAEGHRHDGKSVTSGAYIRTNTATIDDGIKSFGLSYLRIEGMNCRIPAEQNGDAIKILQSANTLIDGCLINVTAEVATNKGIILVHDDGVFEGHVIRNNIIHLDDAGLVQVDGIMVQAISFGAETTVSVAIYNNTIVGESGTDHGIFANFAAVEPCTINIDARNNLVLGFTSCFSVFDNELGGTVAFSTTGSRNNVSSDATGDDWGATGALINQTTSEFFVNSSSDWRQKEGSPAIDAGVTIGSVTVDALGVARPVGAAYDIGALEWVEPEEEPAASSKYRNRPIFLSRGAYRRIFRVRR